MSSLPHPSGATLATRKLLPFGSAFTSHVADLCRCESLDIDLARPLAGGIGFAHRPESQAIPPAVLWVPGGAESAPESVVRLPVVARWLPTAPVLVVDLPHHSAEQMTAIAEAYRLAERVARDSTDCPVAVGLRACHLAGGRRHLANLTLLRRRAEEWGLSIALDLTGSFDPLWEAEAAVLRLGGRLAVVRISSRANLPSAVNLDRVARRAVRAAIEQRRDVRVSIEPDVRWWQRRSARALADAWTVAASRINPWVGPTVRNVAPRTGEERRHRSLPPR